MKKLITMVVAALIGTAAAMSQATQGEFASGANLVYGFGVKSLGIGAKFQYTLIDHVRGEVAFNYFFKKDFVSMWDASINAHYLISVHQENFFLYPLAGFTFAATSYDTKGAESKLLPEHIDKSYSRVGLNLGAGAQYQFSEHIGFTLEYRYSIMKDIDQSVIGLGVNYKF
ncbi:MAG: porin family protein [Muribaculaceae bacterium]|nr:porin family protein [Muribaculaceae bacterium]